MADGVAAEYWAAEVIGEVLITEAEIRETVQRLGRVLTRDYAGKDLLVVGILRGASIFLADLIRSLELPMEIDFISVSSYGAMTKTSGVVRIIKDLAVPIEGKDVIMVEDIVDSGLTWAYLHKILSARNPASLKICSLLDKPGARRTPVQVDYVGFTIENKFVVGYGLDWKGRYRNLPFVMVPPPHLQGGPPLGAADAPIGAPGQE